MASAFQGMVQCRVCEARITVAATRNVPVSRDSDEIRAIIACPICESTVSFDAPGDIDQPSMHVMGFEYDADAFRRKRNGRRPETEGE
jgi:hypothetical protein